MTPIELNEYLKIKKTTYYQLAREIGCTTAALSRAKKRKQFSFAIQKKIENWSGGELPYRDEDTTRPKWGWDSAMLHAYEIEGGI